MIDDIEYAKGLDENMRSLWKISRVLANPLRLELLRLVYTQQGDNCESQLVRAVAARQAIVSSYLNLMVSAGLIGVERDRIKVYFKPWPRHRATEELCRVLGEYFRWDLPENWRGDLIRRIRPFSHFNRLAILGRLLLGPATKDELKTCTGTVVKTFAHHLRIINAAGLLRKDFHGPKPMEISLVRTGDPLMEVMLMYLQQEVTEGADFKNLITDRGLDGASSWVVKCIRKFEGDDWTSPPPERPDRPPIDDELASSLDEINHD